MNLAFSPIFLADVRNQASLYDREACKYTDKENYVAMHMKNDICISSVLMDLSKVNGDVDFIALYHY